MLSSLGFRRKKYFTPEQSQHIQTRIASLALRQIANRQQVLSTPKMR